MRGHVLMLSVTVAALAGGCGDQAASGTQTSAEQAPTSVPDGLPCPTAEQRVTALDIPGPGQPTPEESVAPYAGATTLVAQQDDDKTTVVVLRADGTVFRVFDVSLHDDGWWPDGFRECLR